MKPARLVRLGLGLAFATGTGAQESWSPVISPVTQNLWGVARGGGQFVAVGENGTLISSPDGLAWASRTSGLPDTWLVSAAYGDGIWVVVGDRGRLLTSTDLATWYLRASGTAARLNGVAYGGGRWMIVAESGEVLTSTDAAAWTTLRPSSDRLHGIVHAYGQFAITGDNGLVRTTIDATDFAERVLPGGLFLEAVAYHRRAFVDAGFAPTLLMPGCPAAAAEQADGKILLGGSRFSVAAGLAPFALTRLHPDGSLDATFAVGSGLNSGGSVDLTFVPR